MRVCSRGHEESAINGMCPTCRKIAEEGLGPEKPQWECKKHGPLAMPICEACVEDAMLPAKGKKRGRRATDRQVEGGK